jgi:radical SAM superfamily enzyme YgiQ (UPF0313 family)
MKFLILSENSNGTWPHLHFRSLGSFELMRRITAAGYPVTNLDWFTHWQEDQLKQALQLWFGDHPQPVIAISTPFSTGDVHGLKDLLAWAKTVWPTLTVIHGGSRVYDSTVKNVDVFFLGRSMQIFDDWLNQRDLSKYTVHTDPLVLKNLAFDQYVDVPVVPQLTPSDYITKDDILGFEIGVGCKFNCTFCNYELRGAKVSNLLSREELYKFLSESNKLYGVEHFFIADDTPNESDTKLEILADVVERLDFKPRLTAFARLDIFAARESQHELYKRIQFDSLFFGIESFNPYASKLIRKKSGMFDVYNALKILRSISPETFLVGGLIVGLNGDSEHSIRSSVKRVIDENLLDSVQLYPLSITNSTSIFDEGFLSDLDKNPAEHGYTVSKEHVYRHSDVISQFSWKSDWTNSEDAARLSELISNEIKNKVVSDLNHIEYAGLKSLNLVDRSHLISSIDMIRKRAYNKSYKLKQEYIEKKFNSLKEHSDGSGT